MKHAIVTMAIAFVVGVALYPAFLTVLVRLGLRQHVAAYGPSTHRAKEGTPTLGGALFCAIVVIAWLALDRSREGFVAVFALLAGAFAGALDDVVNIRGSRLGLPVWHKLALQGFVGILIGIGLFVAGFTHQFFPGLGAPNLGWGIIILGALAVVATSNAVNLTDGVDGLAAACAGLVFFGVTAIAVGNGDLPVAIIASALTGSVAAFLVYNWAPARLFMGDTGSLALGCVLAALAAELHLLWFLPLLGIVFLVEALSVIINVTAIRRYGRRVFRASPLHHHFEEMGLREQRLVAAFAAVTVVGTLLTLLVAHVSGNTS